MLYLKVYRVDLVSWAFHLPESVERNYYKDLYKININNESIFNIINIYTCLKSYDLFHASQQLLDMKLFVIRIPIHENNL